MLKHLPVLLFCLMWLISSNATQAAERPIFDAHLHYNLEAYGEGGADAPYPLTKVLQIFKQNNITGMVANSRPNSGSVALWQAAQNKLTKSHVVPFIRLYRTRADYATWHQDPSIFAMVQSEYARGFFKGIGEFHLYNSADANGSTAKKVLQFAQEKQLVILAHCDDVAIDLLFKHAPQAKIIWAHTGFSVSTERVRAMLVQHPTLLGELSYRSGISVFANGKESVSAEWRALFTAFPQRFVLGSDTWVTERWDNYASLMQQYRAWLNDLPNDLADNIAWRNAHRLFALPLTW